MPPVTVYLTLQFASALLFSLIFTVSQVYYVTVVALSPLQLVLIGTILEATVFLFEIPTGVLADVKSRRLSAIIGYAVMGIGFIGEGTLPHFWTIALAQVLWGLGYTFTSGAIQAWIADEVGEARAGEAFVRGSQAARVGDLIAIPISVVLGSIAVMIPIVTGGALMVVLAVFLVLAMTEKGFKPMPPEARTSWGMMVKTLRDARQLVRRQPLLLLLMAIGLFYGLYSEGFDRLWTPYLLESFGGPLRGAATPVVWFGAIRAVTLVLSLLAAEFIRRRVDMNRSVAIARVLMLDAALMVVTLAGFGLTRNLWVALACFWSFGAFRNVAAPLQTAWFNLRIDDPQVRATMFSVGSQVDAIGQIAVGPAIGAVGNRSIRAALVASALILSPVLPLYALAIRRGEDGAALAKPERP